MTWHVPYYCDKCKTDGATIYGVSSGYIQLCNKCYQKIIDEALSSVRKSLGVNH